MTPDLIEACNRYKQEVISVMNRKDELVIIINSLRDQLNNTSDYEELYDISKRLAIYLNDYFVNYKESKKESKE